MELSKHNYKAQQFKNSPLFADSLCVPMDMQYVLLELPTTHHRQDKTSIVMSDVSPDTTFQELENRLISRGIYDNGRSYKILLPKLQKYPINGPFLKEEEGETIEQFKRTYGLRADNVETFYLVVDNALTKWVPLPVPNNNKYELCLMILGERRDVVSFKLEWKSKKDIVNIIVSKVNELFCIGCTVQDLEYQVIQPEASRNAQEIWEVDISKVRLLNKEDISETVFGHKQPTFLAVTIINGEFRVIAQKQRKIAASVSKHNQKRYLVLQLIDGPQFKVKYDEVKIYEILFFLTIFKVEDSHRKGLVVLGQLYKPDEKLSSFQHVFESGVNCVTAAVVSERELFDAFLDEHSNNFSDSQLRSFVQCKEVYKNQVPCLAAYFNQALFPNDHNQNQQLITDVIADYVRNFFVDFHVQARWLRYIRTMLSEMQALESYRGWVFRCVNYQIDKQINNMVEFSNFLVASKREDRAGSINSGYAQGPRTLFRIKCMTGRQIRNIEPFYLDLVIFRPYTSFEVIRLIRKEKLVEYELEEVQPKTNEVECSVLLWVDDKRQQGLNIYKELMLSNLLYPLYFFQATSNAELLTIIKKNSRLIGARKAVKIVISNMKRYQEGLKNQGAGIETYRIVQQHFGNQMQFIFYIGHIEGTIAKLKEQAINLSTCEILNDPNKLYKRLKVLCNHEDLQKVPSEVNKLEEEANDPDWSDFFPHLQSVKSESFKHFK